MASRTVVDSVNAVTFPPPNVAELSVALASLRSAHPGVHIERYLAALPKVGTNVWIAPTAVLVGAVEIADDASVWFGCVLRGDLNRISLGARSNLQDGTVVHVGDNDPVVIEEDVVVGHRAVLHACHIGARSLIGMQATVLDGAHVGPGSVVGAGALVPAGMVIAPRSLVLGVPGRVVRTLGEQDEAFAAALAGKYQRLAHNYLRG